MALAQPKEQRHMVIEYWMRNLLNIPVVVDVIKIINEYASEWARFDKTISNKNLLFSDDLLMVERIKNSKDTGDWIKAFGSIIARPGNYYEWIIKVNECVRYLMIGVIEDDERDTDNSSVWWYQEKFAITYWSDGSVYHPFDDVMEYDEYHQDDTIAVHLDLMNDIVSFSKNDKKFDEIKDFVKQGRNYRFVVGMYGNYVQKVEIIDFKQMNGKINYLKQC